MLEDASQHERAMSARDRTRMHQTISYDRSIQSRNHEFREHVSQNVRSVRMDYEAARLQAKQQVLQGAIRHNKIQAEAAQKLREIENTKAAAMEDIVRQCHSHRSTGPCSPHTPRATFCRLGALQTLDRPTT